MPKHAHCAELYRTEGQKKFGTCYTEQFCAMIQPNARNLKSCVYQIIKFSFMRSELSSFHGHFMHFL